jgi:hypothetical protein
LRFHQNDPFLARGTDGSNPSPSSAESGANLIFAGESHRRLRSPTDVGSPGPHLALQHFDRIGQVAALQRRVLSDFSGYWSVAVGANWRIIFRFNLGNSTDVDLIEYH